MNLSSTEQTRENFSRPAAFALAAAAMLVPANILPVLDTQTGGASRSDTIFSGIVELVRQGLWPIAAIVFVASFMIPIIKIVLLFFLMAASRWHWLGRPRALTKVYSVVNFIGRWSMLDVFLGAFLAGLVAFGGLAEVVPRVGLLAFAAAVVLTVLATASFDPRVFWEPQSYRAKPRAAAR